ncbi:MAG: hypothetical protein GXY52_06125 [Chloroflexi bacterium]|nr:hypothetical protein [Chloroflexota bacterium]
MTSLTSQRRLCADCAMIIPVYFSRGTERSLARNLLRMTLQDTPDYMAWEQVWLVVDGDPSSAELAAELRDELGAYHLLVEPTNRGKLWVIGQGIRAALAANTDSQSFAIRDCDADHALSDLPALLRAAEHLHTATGSTNWLVIGARRSRSRPMGWVRGELEYLLDQVTLEALRYSLAQQGRALPLGLCTSPNQADINSGYKVYGRQLAEYLFSEQTRQLGAISESDYDHFGCETGPVVEALLAGALLAEVPRLTLDGQPTTSFGQYDHTRLYGSILTWLFTRLEIPAEAAAVWFDSHAAHLELNTTAEGRELLGRLRRQSLEAAVRYGLGDAVPVPLPKLPTL